MFEETITKNAKNALEILGKSEIMKNGYLAGGTALALQFGHRISVDLDFFTDKKFDEKIFLDKISELPLNFQLARTDWRTVIGSILETRFSIFYYKYPLLQNPSKYLGINIASVMDIAAMKLMAISDRGTKRDFIDLYFILKIENFFSFAEVFNFYEKKFRVLEQNKFHVIKSLIYFDDAEDEKMPEMLKTVSWKNVKKFFKDEIKKLDLTSHL